jgi:hypothetical protein
VYIRTLLGSIGVKVSKRLVKLLKNESGRISLGSFEIECDSGAYEIIGGREAN